MLPTVRLEFSTRQFSRAAARLRENARPACARALNRSVVTTKTHMAREVSKDTGIKVGTSKDAMAIENATITRLLARVTIRGKRIPLIDFRAKGPEPSRGKGRGVTARLVGGAGRYPRAFIATMKSGKRGVFERVGRARLKIRELRGPSLVKVFEKHSEGGVEVGQKSLVKNLVHEFRWALKKAAGGS